MELPKRLRGVRAGVGEHVENHAATRVFEVGHVVLKVADPDPPRFARSRQQMRLQG